MRKFKLYVKEPHVKIVHFRAFFKYTNIKQKFSAEFLLVDPTPPPQNRYIPSAKKYYEEALRSNNNDKNELRRTTRRRTAKKY